MDILMISGLDMMTRLARYWKLIPLLKEKICLALCSGHLIWTTSRELSAVKEGIFPLSPIIFLWSYLLPFFSLESSLLTKFRRKWQLGVIFYEKISTKLITQKEKNKISKVVWSSGKCLLFRWTKKEFKKLSRTLKANSFQGLYLLRERSCTQERHYVELISIWIPQDRQKILRNETRNVPSPVRMKLKYWLNETSLKTLFTFLMSKQQSLYIFPLRT